MPLELIAEHTGVALLIHAFEKIRKARFIHYQFIKPRVEIRVALSAILRLQICGQYILVRNIHRPETYGPFGGVYKYYDGALNDLDAMAFRPEDLGPGNDMTNDLRGYIPRNRLINYLKWYSKCENRETAPECLRRELSEELCEIGSNIRLPKCLHFKKVRVVEEGPEFIPGLNNKQYRIFEVYDPIQERETRRFYSSIFKLAKSDSKLLAVAGNEILKGRGKDGRLIAHHADYLIGGKRIHPDEAPMQDKYDSAP